MHLRLPEDPTASLLMLLFRVHRRDAKGFDPPVPKDKAEKPVIEVWIWIEQS